MTDPAVKTHEVRWKRTQMSPPGFPHVKVECKVPGCVEQARRSVTGTLHITAPRGHPAFPLFAPRFQHLGTYAVCKAHGEVAVRLPDTFTSLMEDR